jgi:rod shape-determining protein MreC
VTHPAAAVAVQTPEGQVHGLAVGSGREALAVEYVPRSAELLRGDTLVTSSADGIYPPGIPVATVTGIRESDAAFLEVRAVPAARLDTLRVVLLLPEWAREPNTEIFR